LRQAAVRKPLPALPQRGKLQESLSNISGDLSFPVDPEALCSSSL
jgi:hypothetical protein